MSADRCPYCGKGPCHGPRTADGHDLERWYKYHPRQRVDPANNYGGSK